MPCIARNEDGFALTFAALLILPLLAVLGLCFDLGRGWVAYHEATHAVRAAALGGVQRFGSPSQDSFVRELVALHVRPGMLGITAVETDLQIDPSASTVRVAARVAVQTYLMRVFGSSSIALTASAAAQRSGTGPAFEYALIP